MTVCHELLSGIGMISTVTVAPGITVGKEKPTNGRVMLFWKGMDTVVNFGTIKDSVDFHFGEDKLMLLGGRETKVVGSNYLDFVEAGQDTLVGQERNAKYRSPQP